MERIVELIGSGAAGVVLALLYFGGLWLTVRRVSRGVRHAPAWLLLSFAVRAGLVLAGLFAVAAADGGRLVAALAGFVLSRVAVTHWLGPRRAAPAPRAT